MKPSEGYFGLVIAACAAGVTALAFAGPASAADPEASIQVASQRIGYGDLDLTTPRGAHRMLFRIKEAAKSLCEEAPPTIYIQPTRDDLKCEESAIAGAVGELGSAMVSAEYGRETRRADTEVAESR